VFSLSQLFCKKCLLKHTEQVYKTEKTLAKMSEAMALLSIAPRSTSGLVPLHARVQSQSVNIRPAQAVYRPTISGRGSRPRKTSADAHRPAFISSEARLFGSPSPESASSVVGEKDVPEFETPRGSAEIQDPKSGLPLIKEPESVPDPPPDRIIEIVSSDIPLVKVPEAADIKIPIEQPIDLSDCKDPSLLFQVLGRLGEGSYGAVYKALDKRDGKMVAVKVLDFENVEESTQADILKELNLWKDVTVHIL